MTEHNDLTTHRARTLLSASEPVRTEYQDFEVWWLEHAKQLNMRATLTWIELAWAGWYARSEVAEGKMPTVFPRRPGE